VSEAPVEITPAQLLLMSLSAYANLVLMFPLPDGVKKEDDIPAFELPLNYRLFAADSGEFALVRKNPPALFTYVPWNHRWEAVQIPHEKG